MANKNIKGITVEIGGDSTKLGKALESSEKKSKTLQSELKEINKALKFDSSNVELLAQKQTVLTQNIEETSKRLDTLKEAEKQVIAQFERGEVAEEQVRALQREIIETENSLKGMKTQLSNTETSLEALGTEGKDTRSALDKLNDTIEAQSDDLSRLKDEYTNVVLEQGESSEEAKKLASEIEDLNESLKKNKKELADASGKADDLADGLDNAGNKADETEGGFTIMKGALADLVSNAIQSAVSAVGDFVGALMELSEATEEYRTMQSKLEGASKSAGYSADFVKGKYAEFYGYLKDDQASTNAITNLLGIGTSTENLSKLTDGAIAVWSRYGDSIPIEGLTEAINETINAGKVTGGFADTINWCSESNETLKTALGGNKTALKAYNDAIKEGLPVEDAFNEALAKITDKQERADVVAKFLNDTYGESKTTYDELNGSILEANDAELKLKDTQAQLGETMQPVNTALTTMKDQALQSLTPLVEACAKAFMALYHWLQEHPVVMHIITAVVIALASAFTVLAGVLAIQGLIKGVTIAFQFLNTTLLANPIVLIIAGITALVAAFIYLWNNCEGFRNFFISLWEGIKNVVKVVVDWFTQAWNNVIAWFTQAWTDVSTFFTNLWNGIVSAFNTAWNSIISFFTTIGTWIYDNVIAPIAQFFVDLWNGIVSAYHTVIDPWIEIFRRISVIVDNEIIKPIKRFFTQLWTSIKSGATALWNGIKAVFVTVANWFNTNVIKPVANFFKGLWNGLKSGATAVWNGIKAVFSVVANWFNNNIIKPVSNFFTKLWNGFINGAKKAWSGVKSVFSAVGSFFGKVFGIVKDKIVSVFQAGGKVFNNIKDGIVNVFKTVVNGIITGINKVISIPFKGLNGILDKIHGLEIVGVQPFAWLKWRAPVPQIPKLYRGGVLEKGQVGILEGNGAEAVVPLEKETKWINRVAQKMNEFDRANAPISDPALVAKIDEFMATVKGLKSTIVLDTGVLVGETVNAYDSALSTKKTQLARGW